MKYGLLTLSIVLTSFSFSFAQQPRMATQASNGDELHQILLENETITQKRIQEIALENGIPLRMEMPNGCVRELISISPTGQGIYLQTTNNLDAAKTISTNKVWPGGAVGTSLTGSGMTGRIGVWDGGAVRTSHQEFQSRAVQTDGAVSFSDHATHVSGTMIAGGVLATAKGMSYQAPLKCYDWSSDASEMSSAASAGMLVSNHSYSQICGWNYNSNLGRWEWYGDISISAKEDYKYGFYDYSSQNIDQVCVTYPNYLPFFAAGNDRGEPGTIPSTFYVQQGIGNWVLGSSSNPPSAVGPYGCISGGPANAKNVITIGAVNPITGGYSTPSGVVMSSFSGWGPTDDGRIKPDVVANGVSVNSCISTSNTAYATYNGTSMASPNASGSALLIQQHYNNVKGSFMRASTLKGLIIHSADEAGTATGPDYKFGWGLMNTAKAVTTISDSARNTIIQTSVSTGGTYTYTIYTDGTTPIRATISWTDRPGTPPSASLNPSNRLLVNDLDLRVKRNSDNTVFMPYVLDKANPTAVATTGDNNVDNVEQVYIASPSAGTYTITITPKGSITGTTQNFALIVSGITPRPTAAFGVTTNVICATRNVTFTDQSSGAQSRMWYFPGGTPSTSTALNPVVTYYTPGLFPVALRISNPNGYDSIYKVDYMLVGGLALPFSEDFESGSKTRSQWTVENPNSDTTFRLWTIGGTTPGNTAYGINNFDKPTTNLYDRVISPVLDLRGYQSVSLDFMHAYTRYDNINTDSLIISVSTNCGTSYTRVTGYGEYGNGTFATAPDSTFLSSNRFIPSAAAQWCGGAKGAPCYTLDLSAFAGNPNVRIRFEQRSNKGNNLYLDNIRVTGTPLNPVANFYSMNRTVCVGDELQFLDSSRNNPTSWTWTFSDGDTAVSTLRNPSVSFLTPGYKTISLVVANATGRDSIGKTAYINVLPSPAIPSLTSGKGNILCDGDSTVLTTDATTNYAWYKNGVAFSTSLTSFSVKEESNYFVRQFGTNGCNSKTPVMQIQTGNTPPKPVLSKDLTGNVFCEGGTYNITSSSSANNQWFFNDTLFNGKTSPAVSYNESARIMVRVNDKTCYNYSDTLTITKLPKPQTSAISGMPWWYKGDTVNFSITRGISGSVLNWSVVGSTVLSGAGTDNIVVKLGTGATSTITVLETASNCSGPLRTHVISLVNTGLSTINDRSRLHIYPNPASDFIEVSTNGAEVKSGNVEIIDMAGRTIMQTSYVNGHQIEIKTLEKGLYLVRLTSADKLWSGSLIKQ